MSSNDNRLQSSESQIKVYAWGHCPAKSGWLQFWLDLKYIDIEAHNRYVYGGGGGGGGLEPAELETVFPFSLSLSTQLPPNQPMSKSKQPILGLILARHFEGSQELSWPRNATFRIFAKA